MRFVVADTGPLHYFFLIGEIEIIAALAEHVLIPPEVYHELTHPRTPVGLRAWVAEPPPWLFLQTALSNDVDPGLARLGPGERAAIALAVSISADAVLMDDRAGVAAARARGLRTIGTLGLLQRGARRGLLHLPNAAARLAATNFHVRPELLDALLAESKNES